MKTLAGFPLRLRNFGNGFVPSVDGRGWTADVCSPVLGMKRKYVSTLTDLLNEQMLNGLLCRIPRFSDINSLHFAGDLKSSIAFSRKVANRSVTLRFC